MKRRAQLAAFDRRMLAKGGALVGVDEAGRGALAGPVVAAAVRVEGALYAERRFLRETALVNDSKQLTEEAREEAFGRIERWRSSGRVIVGVGRACPREIERHNIFQATALAMRRAIQTLGEDTLEPATDEPLFAAPHENGKRDCLLVDGKPVKALPWRHEALVDGDARSLAIALASVVAKVTRDRLMRELAVAEPRYGFESHKGYGVPLHRERLREHGPCAEHRRSFLRGFLQNGESAARLAGQNLL